jgi:uncharacterized protein YidB (DUF937 family)
MGFLDDLLGGALGGGSIQQSGERRLGGRSPGSGGGMGGVMMALLPVVLSMLASRGGSRQGGGGLGDILGQVLAGAGQSSGSMGDDSMPGSRAGMGGGMGGLGALLEQMQQAGLGDQARSWVGTGENMPVSPDVLSQIFGEGGVGAIARQAGLTPKETSDGLSQLLPEVVNHVTPTGEVPDFDELTRSIDDLRQRMGG